MPRWLSIAWVITGSTRMPMMRPAKAWKAAKPIRHFKNSFHYNKRNAPGPLRGRGSGGLQVYEYFRNHHRTQKGRSCPAQAGLAGGFIGKGTFFQAGNLFAEKVPAERAEDRHHRRIQTQVAIERDHQ